MLLLSAETIIINQAEEDGWPLLLLLFLLLLLLARICSHRNSQTDLQINLVAQMALSFFGNSLGGATSVAASLCARAGPKVAMRAHKLNATMLHFCINTQSHSHRRLQQTTNTTNTQTNERQ